jgi:hypothetical protein
LTDAGPTAPPSNEAFAIRLISAAEQRAEHILVAEEISRQMMQASSATASADFPTLSPPMPSCSGSDPAQPAANFSLDFAFSDPPRSTMALKRERPGRTGRHALLLRYC